MLLETTAVAMLAPHVTWSSPPGECPDAALVRDRLHGVLAQADERDVRVDGELRHVRARYELSLTLTVGDKVVARIVRDRNCAALVDAAVLIARVETVPEARRRANDLFTALPQPSRRRARDFELRMPLPDAPARQAPVPAPPQDSPSGVELNVHLHGGGAAGWVPRWTLAFGTGLDLSLRWRDGQSVPLALALRGTGLLPRQAEFARSDDAPAGSVTVWALSGLAGVGIAPKIGTRFAMQAIAGMRLGGLVGSSTGVSEPARDTIWVGGPALALDAWTAWGRLGLGVQLEGGVQVFRSRFVVDGLGEVYRPSFGWVTLSVLFRVRGVPR